MFLTGFHDHRHSLSTPTADVSYVEAGAGPPALFVHELAANAYVWHNQIGHLSDIRRCIALDLPLHGHSPARPGQQLSARSPTNSTSSSSIWTCRRSTSSRTTPAMRSPKCLPPFFPHECAADLAPHIRRHWATQGSNLTGLTKPPSP